MSNPPQPTPIDITAQVTAAGPAGLTPEALAGLLPGISRSTLNRRLAELLKQGVLKALGEGRARRYVANSPFTRADIDGYFAMPWQSRPAAHFKEELLTGGPQMDADKARRCTQIHVNTGRPPADRRAALFLASPTTGTTAASSSAKPAAG